MNQKICVTGPALPGQLAYLSRTNRRLHTRPLEGPRLLPVLSYLVAAKREKKLIRAPFLPLDISAAISTPALSGASEGTARSAERHAYRRREADDASDRTCSKILDSAYPHSRAGIPC